MHDLLRPVVDKLLRETAEQMPDIPAELHRDYAGWGRWGGFTGGAVVGAKAGAGVGLAMGPLGAIAGTVPGALIGGIIGYFSGENAGFQFEKN